MAIYEVRQYYKSRVKMQPFEGNFSHDIIFLKTNFMCICMESCEEENWGPVSCI